MPAQKSPRGKKGAAAIDHTHEHGASISTAAATAELPLSAAAAAAAGAEQVTENPYLGVVAKKLRNLRKKLEKIRSLEVQAKDGKGLNEEQGILLASKASIEKSIADVEAVRLQLEEVAFEELRKTQSAAVCVETQTDIEQKNSKIDDEPKAENEPQDVADEEELTESVELTEIADQTQDIADSKDLEANLDVPTTDVSETLESASDMVEKLLRLLHVCVRFAQLTGEELPVELDFLGKSILGQTAMPNTTFEEVLMQSVRIAVKYLDDSQAKDIIVVRKTYLELSELVTELSSSIDANPSATDADPAPEPEFNFFTDTIEVTATPSQADTPILEPNIMSNGITAASGSLLAQEHHMIGYPSEMVMQGVDMSSWTGMPVMEIAAPGTDVHMGIGNHETGMDAEMYEDMTEEEPNSQDVNMAGSLEAGKAPTNTQTRGRGRGNYRGRRGYNGNGGRGSGYYRRGHRGSGGRENAPAKESADSPTASSARRGGGGGANHKPKIARARADPLPSASPAI